MAWIKLDDGMPEHEKVAGLSDRAFRIHISALCYAGRMLTDGFVADGVARLYGWQRKTKELVDAGLWEKVEGGHQIHDYLKYNPSRAQVEKEREGVSQARSEAGRKGAAKRWQTDGKPMANGMAKHMANRWQNDGPVPVPDPLGGSNEPPAAGARAPEIGMTEEEARLVRGIRAFENATGTLITPQVADAIEHAFEAYPEDWVFDAIEEAGNQGARAWKYVKRILERWEREGRYDKRAEKPRKVRSELVWTAEGPPEAVETAG